MRCPYCSSFNTKVVDTRRAGEAIRRRRECLDCGRRFTTYERAVLETPLVVKRDGRREEFNRDKILAGVRKACAKRPIAIEDIEGLVDQVESRVRGLGKAEVESKVIGEMVLEKLRDLDGVAYIRFASVYLPLADLESIREEIDKLLAQRRVR